MKCNLVNNFGEKGKKPESLASQILPDESGI